MKSYNKKLIEEIKNKTEWIGPGDGRKGLIINKKVMIIGGWQEYYKLKETFCEILQQEINTCEQKDYNTIKILYR